jgi:ribosomal-protein-alanine N-acetyltransferase
MLNLNFFPFPNLTTEHLELRRLVKEDAPELLCLRSDASVNEYLDRPKTVTLEDAMAYINKIEMGIRHKGWIYWTVALKSNNSLIGTACLWNISREKELAEIGYELMPAYQGKGLMQEAIEKLIEYGFTIMNLKVIAAVLDERNERSVRLLLRNKFKPDTNYEYMSKEEADNLAVYYLKRDEHINI